MIYMLVKPYRTSIKFRTIHQQRTAALREGHLHFAQHLSPVMLPKLKQRFPWKCGDHCGQARKWCGSAAEVLGGWEGGKTSKTLVDFRAFMWYSWCLTWFNVGFFMVFAGCSIWLVVSIVFDFQTNMGQ